MNPAILTAVDLTKQGKSRGEIAASMRVRPCTVSNYLREARRCGIDVPRGKPGRVHFGELNPAVLVAVDLAKRGMTTSQIAQSMGIKPNTASNYLGDARRFGLDVPKCKPGPITRTGLSTIRVSTDLVAKLRPYAAARRMNISDLAAQLLEEIATDGLVDAILDDGDADADA
jgi:DNA-binding CsgD family transcriptional regulator